MKICLVASGGGHLRQILQLRPLFERHDCYLVTEPSPLALSMTHDHRTYFIPHFAFGLSQMNGLWSFLRAGLSNFARSLWLIVRERPDAIVSTGAGTAYFTILFGRLLFRKIVYIETLARVDAPSRFGRIVRPLIRHVIVQWPALKKTWPDAHFCNPLRPVAGDVPPKKAQIFATVGTFLPFERMITELDGLCASGSLSEPVIAQIGETRYPATHIETFAKCSFEAMNAYMADSEIIVCHGGTGSLLGALKAGCKVVAMPRLFEFGEHYDDHQLQIVGAFAEQGLIEVAETAAGLGDAIDRARTRTPVMIDTDPTGLVEIIEALVKRQSKRGKRR